MIPDSIIQISCDEIDLGEVGSLKRVAQFVGEQLVPLIPSSARIITFDGLDGVGKSLLAGCLSEELGLLVIGLDDFLEKERGCFLEALKFGEVESAIADAISLHGKTIVEGCMVEAALKQVGQNPDCRVYVMRTTRMRAHPEAEWITERELLYGEHSAEQLIADKENRARRWAQHMEGASGEENARLPEIVPELIRYNHEYRPHDRADVIIKIVRWQ